MSLLKDSAIWVLLMNDIFVSTGELIPVFRELLENGQKISVKITGNSMFPLFSHRRDTLTLEKKDKYKKRDIVMYVRSNGELVIHRIYRVKKDYFVLCGDNQHVAEFPIYESQIMGAVTEFERKGRRLTVSSLPYRLYSFFWCLGLEHRKPFLLFALKLRNFKFRVKK